ncbi:hypothetical protein ADU80_02750 [Clostridium botulinum]|uniref:DUF4250 domain-containing protein n=2 Tax=Clostridium botulinum TaxID=1491 RepID=A0A9Q1ZCL8_CLOBO|nr:DUF4250 domain-containing protein [Clostridium botulinum]KEI03347.1 hypothetical protein Z953_05130 [Clostridium botulinum D str. 16868]KEI05423.1 hypothetical protein Y848_09030 [Clostridium botulinum C/D str. Sp77]KLU75224.1 hypothetical protein CBC3_09965 [Clostridium botulinum V891]KOA73397.1 hypothetical protein ADU78_12670 [Clostridium botulinum]KOA80729.1 hypothetical protein ADU77_00750 [Clostridium botulinum]
MLSMDPYMLLSFINTKLRDEFSSLEYFCDDFDISVDEIKEKLSSIGYEYNLQNNQFKLA